MKLNHSAHAQITPAHFEIACSARSAAGSLTLSCQCLSDIYSTHCTGTGADLLPIGGIWISTSEVFLLVMKVLASHTFAAGLTLVAILMRSGECKHSLAI